MNEKRTLTKNEIINIISIIDASACEAAMMCQGEENIPFDVGMSVCAALSTRVQLHLNGAKPLDPDILNQVKKNNTEFMAFTDLVQSAIKAPDQQAKTADA